METKTDIKSLYGFKVSAREVIENYSYPLEKLKIDKHAGQILKELYPQLKGYYVFFTQVGCNYGKGLDHIVTEVDFELLRNKVDEFYGINEEIEEETEEETEELKVGDSVAIKEGNDYIPYTLIKINHRATKRPYIIEDEKTGKRYSASRNILKKINITEIFEQI